jgi:PAS domain S-box-containing protein
MKSDTEQQRLEALRSFEILDTLPEKEYDNITSIAARICDTPISLVSLVTDTRQFFKSNHGLFTTETPIDQSFCAQAIKNPEEILIIEDARKDIRFKDNPLVTGNPNIVFYAGVPLITNEGIPLGTLCIIDDKPRKMEPNQLSSLDLLAQNVVQFFELRKNKIELIEISNSLAAESLHVQNIIDLTKIGVWEWDIQSSLVSINERCADILGYTLEELSPIHVDQLQNFVYPKDFLSITDKIKACLKKQIDYYDDIYRCYHKKGHILWLGARGKVISWSDEGKPLIMVGTLADITEHKTAETQFKTIINNIPGVVFRYNLFPDGTDKLMLVSDGAKVLWDFSADQVMQNINLIWDRTEKDDLEALYLSIQKSAEDLSFWEHEWRYRHSDGTTKWFKGSGNPFSLEDGTISWDSIILDITDQKENQLKVKQSEKRFKSLVQNGSDLVSIINIENSHLYLSPTYLALLGITAEESMGKSFIESIHPDDKEYVSASIKGLKNEEQAKLNPYRFRHGDGSWRWLETIVTNLLNDSSISGIVANSKDITERYNHIEALKYKNEKLEKIAWTQSHIVRAPLARIMALAEVIKDDSSSIDQNKKIIEYILDSAFELDDVIRDIVNSTGPDL